MKTIFDAEWVVKEYSTVSIWQRRELPGVKAFLFFFLSVDAIKLF